MPWARDLTSSGQIRRTADSAGRRSHTAGMSTVRTAQPASETRVVLGSAAVAAGVAIVLIGVALPWLTLQHGQQSVNGVLADGAYLATAAIGAGALWTAYLVSGRPGPLRALAAGAAFLVVYWTIFDVERIVSAVTDDPLAGAMGAPLMGPGPLVAALGGIVLLGATISVPSLARGLRRAQWMRVLLAAALLATGAIHLQQAPEHLEVSALLGLGFLAAAISQLGLGAIVLVRGHRLLYAAIVADCALFFVLYVVAVMHGLPFPNHNDPGLQVGAGEAVTLSGVLSKLGEAVAIMLALPLALRR
jgi:hypothetical protein